METVITMMKEEADMIAAWLTEFQIIEEEKSGICEMNVTRQSVIDELKQFVKS